MSRHFLLYLLILLFLSLIYLAEILLLSDYFKFCLRLSELLFICE